MRSQSTEQPDRKDEAATTDGGDYLAGAEGVLEALERCVAANRLNARCWIVSPDLLRLHSNAVCCENEHARNYE